MAAPGFFKGEARFGPVVSIALYPALASEIVAGTEAEVILGIIEVVY